MKQKKRWGGYLSALMLLLSSSGLKYLFSQPAVDTSRWTAFWCRARGHSSSVVWYSSGLEPDMHCKRCFDDLG